MQGETLEKLVDLVRRQSSELRRLASAVESLRVASAQLPVEFLPPRKATQAIQRIYPDFRQRSLEYCRQRGIFEQGTHWIDASLPGSEVPRYRYNAEAIAELVASQRDQWSAM